jgi:hypothetical protein
MRGTPKGTKGFFSEEKKQKTFTPAPAQLSGHVPDPSAVPEADVFWFFSWEKNKPS